MQISKQQTSAGYDVNPIPLHTYCDHLWIRYSNSEQWLQVRRTYQNSPCIADLAAANRTVAAILSGAR